MTNLLYFLLMITKN